MRTFQSETTKPEAREAQGPTRQPGEDKSRPYF